MIKRTKDIAVLAAVALGLYIGVTQVVFAFRHPWATETECFLHMFDAMAFRYVPYDDMRPRGEP